jgi:hypothetical protein
MRCSPRENVLFKFKGVRTREINGLWGKISLAEDREGNGGKNVSPPRFGLMNGTDGTHEADGIKRAEIAARESCRGPQHSKTLARGWMCVVYMARTFVWPSEASTQRLRARFSNGGAKKSSEIALQPRRPEACWQLIEQRF